MRGTRAATLRGAAGAAAVGAAAGAACAQVAPGEAGLDEVRALVIDGALETRLGWWTAAAEGGLVVVDEDGAVIEGVIAAIAVRGEVNAAHGVGARSSAQRPTTRERERWLAMLEAGGSGPTGEAWLVDGQRVAGGLSEPVSAGSGGDGLRWSAWSAGERPMILPLERLDRAVLVDDPAVSGRLDAAPADEDMVILANGDAARGFVASLGGPAVVETVEGELSAPLDVVAGVSLANPAEAAAEGVRLWLDDGSVLGVEAARVIGGGTGVRVESVLFGASAEPLDGDERADGDTPGMGVIPAIGLLAAAEAGRITPLWSIAPTSQRASDGGEPALRVEVERHPDDLSPLGATPLGLRDVVLPGPMTVSWALPPDAARFAATADLAGGSSRWGDCELIVRVDGEPALRQRLAVSDQTTVAINLAVEGGASLDVTVEAGAFGPIGDRIALRRPMLLLADRE